jgi:Predicted phosphatase/phosphohexomutase
MSVLEKEQILSRIEEFSNSHQYTAINVKAVLIDMDGVLYDSMKNHARSWKMTADKFNIPSEENEFYLYEGQQADTLSITYLRGASEEKPQRMK